MDYQYLRIPPHQDFEFNFFTSQQQIWEFNRFKELLLMPGEVEIGKLTTWQLEYIFRDQLAQKCKLRVLYALDDNPLHDRPEPLPQWPFQGPGTSRMSYHPYPLVNYPLVESTLIEFFYDIPKNLYDFKFWGYLSPNGQATYVGDPIIPFFKW